jgi:glycosyltransferase involved in cell wall biosynthesis
MANIVIQQSAREYPDFADYLAESGFECINLGTSGKSYRNKLSIIGQTVAASIRLLSHLRQLRNVGVIVAFGHFVYVIRLLSWLRIIRYEESFCFAFFVHSPSWFRIFRWLARLDTEDDRYLIFSRAEIDLYAEKLGIDRDRMRFLPYGDWQTTAQIEELDAAEAGGEFPADYYFAGGYSNRDYLSLIDAFRPIPHKLIVVCSSLNKELDSLPLPPNVVILRDLPSAAFESYIRHAKACILPLKHDTGASGQSVIVRHMRNAKLTIANDIGSIREYIEHGKSGFLVSDWRRELPELISRLESEPGIESSMGAAAYEKYVECYSRKSVAELCAKILSAAA